MPFEVVRREATIERSVRLPDSIAEWVKATAKRQGVKPNQVIAAALEFARTEDRILLEVQRKEGSKPRGTRILVSVDKWIRTRAERENVSENQIVIAAIRVAMAEGDRARRR